MKNHTTPMFNSKRNFFLLLFTLVTTCSFSQAVSINTTNPLGIFHIDAKGDNPAKGNPTQKQQDNDFIVKDNGNVGIGTAFPTNKLHIVANENFAPLKIEKLPLGDIMKDQVLVMNENNVIKKSIPVKDISVPKYAIFTLKANIEQFLVLAAEGDKDRILMTNIYNDISGLIYDEYNAAITFPKGTYQVELTYMAFRQFCKHSSYYVDFLEGDFNTTQVYNTTMQPSGGEGHTGQFTHVFTLTQTRKWQINMGRGRAGECWGFGTTLVNYGTQLIVTKLN